VALSASGLAEASEPFEGRGGVTFELEEASLAFGPFTLCAGYQAGELCETALAEWPDAQVVDVLSSSAQELGVMEAVTGTSRSFMYDLGRVSLLTQEEPLVTEAASSLGGASVRLRGSAELDTELGTERIDFVAELPIQQEEGTERGVPVVRSSGGDAFERELSAEGEALTLRFDPRAWLSTVDLAGAIEDCAAEGGCAEPLRFEEGSQGWLSIRNGVVAGARPELEWGER
jgi:hypothetical protein